MPRYFNSFDQLSIFVFRVTTVHLISEIFFDTEI